MIKSMPDFYLIYINRNNKSFGIVVLQINNIFILVNYIFTIVEKKNSKERIILIKNREKLTLNTSIMFNKGYIRLIKDNSFFF